MPIISLSLFCTLPHRSYAPRLLRLLLGPATSAGYGRTEDKVDRDGRRVEPRRLRLPLEQKAEVYEVLGEVALGHCQGPQRVGVSQLYRAEECVRFERQERIFQRLLRGEALK